MTRVNNTNHRWFEKVWQHGPAEVRQRLMLLALIDKADAEGAIVGMKVYELGDMIGLREKGAQLVLRALREDGWVTTSRPMKGPGNGNVYHLNLDRLRGDGS